MSAETHHRPGLKTWSALMGSRKRPSEYEVVSYKLHYRNRNPEAPYEQSPNLRMNEWYKKHVFGSPAPASGLGPPFRDPDEVTYRAYCTMQDAQEQYVDGLLNAHDQNGHGQRSLCRLGGQARDDVHAGALSSRRGPDGVGVSRANGAGEHHHQLRPFSRKRTASAGFRERPIARANSPTPIPTRASGSMSGRSGRTQRSGKASASFSRMSSRRSNGVKTSSPLISSPFAPSISALPKC